MLEIKNKLHKKAIDLCRQRTAACNLRAIYIEIPIVLGRQYERIKRPLHRSSCIPVIGLIITRP